MCCQRQSNTTEILPASLDTHAVRMCPPAGRKGEIPGDGAPACPPTSLPNLPMTSQNSELNDVRILFRMIHSRNPAAGDSDGRAGGDANCLAKLPNVKPQCTTSSC